MPQLGSRKPLSLPPLWPQLQTLTSQTKAEPQEEWDLDALCVSAFPCVVQMKSQ